jgi:hypothetical protein
VWIASGFLSALGLAGLVIATFGAGERGASLALQATGRLAFFFFWLAYSGGALNALFGSVFDPLKRRGRVFGLAFAAVQLVHIGLVGWLCIIGAAPALGTFVFFGIAVFWTGLLALFSFVPLGPAGWWVLRVVGLNYIAYAFAVDFLRSPIFSDVKHLVGYLPFAILSVAGPMLRLAAYLRRALHLRGVFVKRSS